MSKAKYESELKRCIADIIISQVSDARLGWITVNEVALSSDYRKARVFISIFGDEELSLMILNNASGFIRHSLSKQLPWRRVPEISFDLYKQEWIGNE